MILKALLFKIKRNPSEFGNKTQLLQRVCVGFLRLRRLNDRTNMLTQDTNAIFESISEHFASDVVLRDDGWCGCRTTMMIFLFEKLFSFHFMKWKTFLFLPGVNVLGCLRLEWKRNWHWVEENCIVLNPENIRGMGVLLFFCFLQCGGIFTGNFVVCLWLFYNCAAMLLFQGFIFCYLLIRF